MTLFRIGTLGRDTTIYHLPQDKRVMTLRLYSYPSSPDFYKSEDICDLTVWIENGIVYAEGVIPNIFKYYNHYIKAYFSYTSDNKTFALSSIEMTSEGVAYSNPDLALPESIGQQFLGARLLEFLK